MADAKEFSLRIDGKDHRLEAVSGTEGDVAVDIAALRAETGIITLDYGYGNTGSTESSISYVDGAQGALRYRGYKVQELAEYATFLEVAYLLMFGELPDRPELEEYADAIKHHTLLNEEMKKFFDAFPRNAHPMGILSAATAAMSTFYEDYHDPLDPEAVQQSARRLMAKIPTVAAFAYRKSTGKPYVYPRNDLDYPANFLQMMFALPVEDYQIDPVVARAMDVLLILHADHGQNCSTSTVRMVGSSQANLFASVAAGMNALWGPLHGGANSAVIEMLGRIHDDGHDLAKYIEKAKDRNDPFRLMGFGHRVYKNYDPRARILKGFVHELMDRLGVTDPLLELAMKLEEVALSDDYFIERNLYPNVDFYSGTMFRAMGFPTRMFTVLFALGRLPGWIAQWKEMIEDPRTRIGRPRQVYQGPTTRPFQPIEQR